MPDREESFTFTCPHCGDPSATTTAPEIDVHAGATYVCHLCGQRVIFEAFTADEYVAYAKLRAENALLKRSLALSAQEPNQA